MFHPFYIHLDFYGTLVNFILYNLSYYIPQSRDTSIGHPPPLTLTLYISLLLSICRRGRLGSANQRENSCVANPPQDTVDCPSSRRRLFD